jgi:hypothetical protein
MLRRLITYVKSERKKISRRETGSEAVNMESMWSPYFHMTFI